MISFHVAASVFLSSYRLKSLSFWGKFENLLYTYFDAKDSVELRLIIRYFFLQVCLLSFCLARSTISHQLNTFHNLNNLQSKWIKLSKSA